MATFSIQRLHPALGTDFRNATHSRLAKVFLGQGALDKACGLCCLVMALILLGEANHEEAERLLGTRHAALRRLRRRTTSVFAEGMSEDDFVEAVAATTLKIDAIRGESGEHRLCLSHTVRGLQAGRISALGIASKDWGWHHWVLAVGLEGMERDRRFAPNAILCLDPSSDPWPSCGFNARLLLNVPRPGARYLRYSSSNTPRSNVTVSNAVVLSKRRIYA